MNASEEFLSVPCGLVSKGVSHPLLSDSLGPFTETKFDSSLDRGDFNRLHVHRVTNDSVIEHVPEDSFLVVGDGGRGCTLLSPSLGVPQLSYGINTFF